MSALGLSLGTGARALGVAVLSVVWAYAIQGFLRPLKGGCWLFVLGLLMAPFVWPHLLTGYVYANSAFPWMSHAIGREVFYDALLVVYLLPLAVGMIHISPPPSAGPRARHCLRLLGRTTDALSFPRRDRWTDFVRDRLAFPSEIGWTEWWVTCVSPRLASVLPAVSIPFLIAFQEFELASALGVPSWTVSIFDAHAGGLPWSSSLRLGLLPVVCEIVALLPMWVWYFHLSDNAERRERTSASPSFFLRLHLAELSIVAGFTLFCAYPCGWILWRAGPGWRNVFGNWAFHQEIVLGLGIAAIAASASYGVASWSRSFRWLAPLVSLPGLLGSLVVSLVVLAIFQLPLVIAWYATPVPWWLGQTLVLLPRAILFSTCLAAWRRDATYHTAWLLTRAAGRSQRRTGRELCRDRDWLASFACICALAYAGYLDVTTASILAPSGVASAPSRLYNLMHYGQSSVLSAMTIEATLLPILVVLVSLGVAFAIEANRLTSPSSRT